MRFTTIIAGAALLCTAPVAAEVTDSSESGFVVTHEAEVDGDPDEVFAMLRLPEKWWSAEHSWTGDAENFYMGSQATGCFCEQIPSETPDGMRGSVEHARIVFSQPGKMLRLRGALGPLQSEAVNGVLTITLAPDNPAPDYLRTKVKFEYVVGGYMRFPVDQIAPAVDAVIGQQITGLAAVLDKTVEEPSPEEEPGAEEAEDEEQEETPEE